MDTAALSLSGVSGAVLTEGIKFLYSQAGELLDRRRQKRDQAGTEEAPAPPLQADVILDSFPGEGGLDDEALARYEEQLIELRSRLDPYVAGAHNIVPLDAAVIADVDALRTLLETICRQQITFVGERRPAAGTRIEEHESRRVEASGSGSVAIGGNNSAPVTTNIYGSAPHANDLPRT